MSWRLISRWQRRPKLPVYRRQMQQSHMHAVCRGSSLRRSSKRLHCLATRPPFSCSTAPWSLWCSLQTEGCCPTNQQVFFTYTSILDCCVCFRNSRGAVEDSTTAAATHRRASKRCQRPTAICTQLTTTLVQLYRYYKPVLPVVVLATLNTQNAVLVLLELLLLPVAVPVQELAS